MSMQYCKSKKVNNIGILGIGFLTKDFQNYTFIYIGHS